MTAGRGVPGGYREAVEAAAWIDRSGRGRIRIAGRDPRRMLDGVLTGALPGPLAYEGGHLAGSATESAALTPKGKTISEMRVLPWWDPSVDEAFLLDVPRAGVEGLLAHFGRFLPPRFASTEDLSEETGMLTVVGPEAPALLAEAAGVPAERLEGAEAGTVVCVGDGPETALRLVASGEVEPEAWDLLGPRVRLEAAREALADAAGPGGIPELDDTGWEALRVEAGRPFFGADLDDSTIPVEAGIDRRVIDHGKGCYTGQEVIVRIRDRGRVNRHLRGLLLGDVEPPPAGAGLHADGRRVGEITSVVRSPRYGQVAALGYVRREVEPGGSVRVGAADGPEAEVRELGPAWGE